MVFIGIDLGTTNSAVAAFDGETVSVIANALGENLTPSAVRLDSGGAPTVGRKALRFLQSDPANTCAEWKRLMGTAEPTRFAAAGKTLLPEELSAQVLGSLLADARDVLGFAPRAAVISTPALFELPQNHATVRAGKLAGLDEVLLIQEPIASAIAAGWRAEHAGTWLVFDLGGGTLDVSLLETRDGRLRVVDHAGDNFLGGKDIDRALVDWAVAELGRRGEVTGLDRGDARSRRALARLKAACEEAKIELTRCARAAITVSELAAGGETVDVELPITRADLDALVEPVIGRSLAVVRRLLAANARSPEDVARVVLVGGPTLTPAIRARVGDLFGGRIAEGVDAMTVVARGAALYAATAGLDARPAARAGGAKTGLAVRIEHPAVTADLEPFVVGRCLPGEGEALPARVRCARVDAGGLIDGWQSTDLEVSAEGSFVLQVKLERHRQNRFAVHAFAAAGAPVALATDGFTIVHGVSVADPPLSRSVGVACANDSAQIYFSKGTPLPARKTFVHQTVKAIAANSAEDALAIPIVQGESLRAHRNRLIGMLRITGVKRDLPAGSRIEVTLQLDRSGQLHTRADVPAAGQSFEEVAHVLVPTASLGTAEREIVATGRRAAELSRRAFAAGLAAAAQAIDGVAAALAEADRDVQAARGGDAEAAQKLQRGLQDANAALDEGEAILAWPDLETETLRWTLYYTPLVARWGTPPEQQLFDQALQATLLAQKARNASELERHLEALRSIGKASYCRDPQTLSHELAWVGTNVTMAMDVARAQHLIERARVAEAAGDRGLLTTLVAQIRELFPSSPAQQEKSYGSGVR
jgi:molecular chaperone DnaK